MVLQRTSAYHYLILFYSYQTSIPSYQVCDLKQINPPQTLQTHTTWRHFPGFRLLLPIPTSCYLFREAIDPRRVCRTQGWKHSVNSVGEGAQILGIFTASGVTQHQHKWLFTTGKLLTMEIHGSPWRFNIMMLFTSTWKVMCIGVRFTYVQKLWELWTLNIHPPKKRLLFDRRTTTCLLVANTSQPICFLYWDQFDRCW